MGTGSTTFTVEGIANDMVTILLQPGTTGFLTLQTECGAKADMTTSDTRPERSGCADTRSCRYPNGAGLWHFASRVIFDAIASSEAWY